ncbi:MAG: hypothetical protein ACHQWU_01595 [Gemmatimonadales bacterium]
MRALDQLAHVLRLTIPPALPAPACIDCPPPHETPHVRLDVFRAHGPRACPHLLQCSEHDILCYVIRRVSVDDVQRMS